MTTFPLLDCCQMLSIDPKTLRNWLKQASMPLHDHPNDARVKCLTYGQIQQLAVLHHRALKPPQISLGETAGEARASDLPVVPTQSELAASRVKSVTGVAPSQAETDLLERLTLLEKKVAVQQEQLTQLALQLLQERDQCSQRHLMDLTVLWSQTVTPPQPQFQETPEETTEKHKQVQKPPRQSSRGRPVLPLIEYGADDRYVVICPERGELFLTPDSPDWFEWLSTLSSFRFIGQHGRLSAYRNRGRSTWIAYRRIHCQRYDHALGSSVDVTVNCLERMAAKLQSYVPSL